MKKLIIMLVAVLLLLPVLSACMGNDDVTTTTTTAATTTTSSSTTSSTTTSSSSSTSSTTSSSTSSSTTSSQQTPPPQTPPTEYSVTFLADGQIVDIQYYTMENPTITEPTVPTKDHYNGTWQSYTLNGISKTVHAVYTPKEYTVTFKADGVTVDTCTYTVENKSITAPDVPNKAHYNGVWEDYTLNGGNVTVEAIYTAAEYTITFKADGVTVATKTYTVENKTVTAPDVPAKEHYTGVWATYLLSQLREYYS